MHIIPLKSPVLKQGFDIEKSLKNVLKKNHQKVQDGDILVISSKILALSQNRVVKLVNKEPEIRALVLRESDAVFPGPILLSLKDGVFIARAGIDFSNAAKGTAILWPKKKWQTVRNVWKKLKSEFHIKKLGLIISDSHCQPLRWGVTGLAIAWAGFEGVEDARGTKDIYGKPLKVTRKAVADNLASAALLLMGEAGEKIPFVLIRNAPVKFTNQMQRKNEIFIKPKDCLFSGIYSKEFLKLVR